MDLALLYCYNCDCKCCDFGEFCCNWTAIVVTVADWFLVSDDVTFVLIQIIYISLMMTSFSGNARYITEPSLFIQYIVRIEPL